MTATDVRASAYRADPEWISAQSDYVADARPGECADKVLVRRIAAAHEMHRIESSAVLLRGGGE